MSLDGLNSLFTCKGYTKIITDNNKLAKQEMWQCQQTSFTFTETLVI